MLTDWLRVGWRPILAGTAALIVAAIAGWGVGSDAGFRPVRWLRRWLGGVIVPALAHRRWAVRSAFIFLNNTSIAALVILAGALPAGSWTAIVIVGLSMGIAARLLTDDAALSARLLAGHPPIGGVANTAAPSATGVDFGSGIGLALNLLEVPALAATMGLSIGQRAAPNGLAGTAIWQIFVRWLLPLFLVAALGESLWIGRLRPPAAPPRPSSESPSGESPSSESPSSESSSSESSSGESSSDEA